MWILEKPFVFDKVSDSVSLSLSLSLHLRKIDHESTELFPPPDVSLLLFVSISNCWSSSLLCLERAIR